MQCNRRRAAGQGARQKLSGNNRNVRILATVEMSGVWGLSLWPLEGLPPRMILRWAMGSLGVIVRPAVGRIGLRRSATRAPAGRLYARGRRLRRGGPAFFRLRI